MPKLLPETEYKRRIEKTYKQLIDLIEEMEKQRKMLKSPDDKKLLTKAFSPLVNAKMRYNEFVARIRKNIEIDWRFLK